MNTYRTHALIIVVVFVGVLLGGHFLLNQLPPLSQRVSPASQTAQVVSTLSDGLVAYYSFDEGSGTIANDSSGNGNTATLLNGTAWTTGKVGSGALQLDGDNDAVRLPTSLPTLTEFTLSGWINLNSGATGRNPFWSANASDRLMFNNSGTSYLSLNNKLASPAGLTPGQWIFVLIERSGTTARYYQNGSLVSTWDIGATSTSFTGSSLGDQGAGYYNLNGMLDEVRLYNRALTSSEIVDLYNYVAPATASSTTPTVTSSPSPSPTTTTTSPTPTPTAVSTSNKVERLSSSGSVLATYTTIQACANAATAGQTCLVYAGSYDERVTLPNSGLAGSPITFQSNGGVKVRGFNIFEKNYINVKGFEITHQGLTLEGAGSNGSSIYLRGSNYIQIADNTIHDTVSQCVLFYQGYPQVASYASNHVTISHNTMYHCGYMSMYNGSSAKAGASGIEIFGNYNLIDNNDISRNGEDFTRLTGGDYDVIRNNYFHDNYDADFLNYDPTAPTHIDGIQNWCAAAPAGSAGYLPTRYALYENNYMVNGTDSNTHFTIFQDYGSCGEHNFIIRENRTKNIGSSFGFSDKGVQKIYGYNNTLVDMGVAAKPWEIISASNNSGGTKVVNNIFYNTVRDSGGVYYYDSTSLPFYANFNLAYNSDCSTTCLWTNPANGIGIEPNAVRNKDPLFTNYGSNDFHLQTASPAVDKGGPLTLVSANDTGSGSTIIVDDAGFFQAGQGGIVNADWIAVGTPTNVAQITSINYDTNTITLSTSLSRKAGDPIYLYKDSNGQRVLYGNAPDIGAFESGNSANTTTTTSTDTTAPVLSQITASSVGISTASINWTTSEPATSRVEYGESTSYGALTTTDTTLTSSHSVGLANLFPGTTYHYRVISSDASGNTAMSGDAAFTTLQGDILPPDRSNGLPTGTLPAGTVNTILRLTTDEVAVCKYSTNAGMVFSTMTPFASTNSTSHSSPLSNLTAGTYTYYVKCQDGAGNVNPTDYPIIFSIASSLLSSDTIASQVTITRPLNGETWTAGRLTITANAADNVGVAGVTFYVNGQKLGSEVTVSPYKINWKATVGTYTITAKARDAAGNVGVSSPVTVTIVSSTAVKKRASLLQFFAAFFVADPSEPEAKLVSVAPTIPAVSSTKINSKPAPYIFNRPLKAGQKHADVRQLQKYLNTHGYLVAKSGAGSLGNETTYFGTATKNALLKLQQANRIRENGVLGPLTRQYINSHQ